MKCKCKEVTNRNRSGPWALPPGIEVNEFAESEVMEAKRSWKIVGISVPDMTKVWKCTICNQLWGDSPAGHGWSSYRRLEPSYPFSPKAKED
jgi:hypothetical protein